ncbi:MAG: DUF3631 domain-containing protein [Thiotrichales bacterium]|nr:DUF3631 domain-containing protein [Thiotrichales bacterium]
MNSTIETAKGIQATKAEGELRKAAVEALKRNGLPEDLIERTKTLPGSPFEHQTALARLPDADRANLRKAFKDFAGLPIADFDKLTRASSGESSDRGQGRPIEWDDPEPWPDPVVGAALLGALKAKAEHYASLPEGGAVAVALWALYTWVFLAFAVSPYLMVTAPEREAGKTRVTELLSWIVRRPKPASDASVAALFRMIDRDGPTILFDEAQHFLKRRPEDPMRGILLAGFTRRLAAVDRCVGESNEVRTFSTFAPKAMNGRKLAGMDDMLTSRSVVIPMTRATRPLPELRADRDPVGEDLRRKCARWAADNEAMLRDADPDTDRLIGRIAQVWRPLFAIADAAGGDWPMLARAAAYALSVSAAAVADGETLGTMLLADIREVFQRMGDPERLSSKELDRALIELPERPWSAMPRTGKAITPQARGRMLAEYGIQAKTLRFDGGKDAKGYERASFAEAWAAYLSDEDCSQTVEPLTCRETRHLRDSPTVDTEIAANGSDDTENPEKQGTSTVQRFGSRGARGNGADSTSAPVSMPMQPPGTERAGDAYRRARDGE